MLVLILLALAIAAGFSAAGIWVALRTGSGEAVQGQFPVFFFLIFISSMNLPRNLIEADWFRTIASWNPVSYLVEGLRSLVITGWDGTALWRCLVTAIAISIVGFAGASSSLRTRMART
jgi:ABC-2 type transport system permease protein